ncbi:MAG: hypothetical protein JXQ27_14285 [Acidobacteria bacterium]|nr:hypothetical protein [Acidobacteriota bacterium]
MKCTVNRVFVFLTCCLALVLSLGCGNGLTEQQTGEVKALIQEARDQLNGLRVDDEFYIRQGFTATETFDADAASALVDAQLSAMNKAMDAFKESGNDFAAMSRAVAEEESKTQSRQETFHRCASFWNLHYNRQVEVFNTHRRYFAKIYSSILGETLTEQNSDRQKVAERLDGPWRTLWFKEMLIAVDTDKGISPAPDQPPTVADSVKEINRKIDNALLFLDEIAKAAD